MGIELSEIRVVGDVEELIRQIGPDFQPGQPACTYLADGRRRFTDEQAVAVDQAIDTATAVCARRGTSIQEVAQRVTEDLRRGPWPSIEELVVVLIGGPVNGLDCYGPLPNWDSLSGEETHELRHEPWWLASIQPLDIWPGDRLGNQVEVALALLANAAKDARTAGEDAHANALWSLAWQLRDVQLGLTS